MKKTYQNAKRLSLLLLSFMLLSYVHGQIVVTGTVMDGEFGGGLPGANVVVKGSTTGTSTDIDGKYSIKVPDENAVLQFSSIGFATQSIKVGEKRVIDLTLKKDVKQIEEVVKVGYGVQKKTDVTGSVTQLGGDDIANRPVIGVDQAMAGKAAGVSVTSNSGSPGSEALVRIRGTGSINNADPLYVVDGIPQGGIPSINPTEIKSISVLKDASACAIYGSRAANGVILITTKEGKVAKKSKDCESSSQSEISFDSYYGIQKIERYMDVANAGEYYQLYKKNNPNSKITVPSYADTTGEGTDWQKEIYRLASTQRHTLSYESGSDISSIRISANFLKQEGIVKTTDYQSTGFGGKANHNLKKWLTIQETFGFSMSKKHLISEGAGIYNNNPVLLALIMDPTVPVKSDSTLYTDDTSGHFGMTTNFYNGVFNKVRNPMRVIDLNNQQNANNGYNGSFMITLTPIKNLSIVSQIGAYGYNNKYESFEPLFYQSGEAVWYRYPKGEGSKYQLNQSQGFGYTLTNTATYNIERKDSNQNLIHNISLMVGNETYYKYGEGVTIDGYKMNPTLTEKTRHISMADSSVVSKNNIPSELAMQSLLGRLNYSLKNRYLLTVNIRYDWTSRFTKENRLGVFPSFSLGWKLSDEDFFKNNEKLKYINECKVRVGWGTIGNSNTVDDQGYDNLYPYAASMRVDKYRNYSFGGVLLNGATLDKTPNANLIWETAKMWNAGLDFALLQNKMTLSFDWFNKKTSNMIVSSTLPIIAGAEVTDIVNVPDEPTIPINAGSVLNTGIETTIGYNGTIPMKNKLNYEIGGNYSLVKNVVGEVMNEAGIPSKALPNPQNDFLPCLTQEGYGIADFYGLQSEGVYNNWEEINNGPKMPYAVQPGDFKYKDMNGDGFINNLDYVHLGSPLPKMTYGFYLNGDIAMFDFNLSFQGSYGNKVFNALKYFLDANGEYNYSTRRLNAWTEENQSNEPRLGMNSNNWSYPNSNFVENASYLKFKDITIGATMPEKLVNKLKIKKLRLYVQIQNIYTWTKYSGYNPEVGQLTGTNSSQKTNTMLGVDLGTYPQARTFLGGLNFTF